MVSNLKDTAEVAGNMAIDLAVENAAQQFQNVTADELRLAANNLISYVDKIVEENQRNQAIANGMGSSTNIEQVMNFSKKMIDTKEKFSDLMSLVFDFQNKANAFLGQKVQMTFVYIDPKTGEVNLYAVDNDVEHLTLDKASSSHGGDITGRYKYSKKAMEQMTKIVNSRYQEKDSHLQSTFSEVYKRYNISKARMKMAAAYILWKINGEWDGAWVSGAGPFGEAYFAFFVNEYMFSGMVEQDVRDFMLNDKYGAIKADNASGFLQGDVSKNGMEYGIKIQSATALGYMEIIKYARMLLEATDVETFLLGLKEELAAKGVANMVKNLEGNLEKVSQDLINDMQNYLDNH